MDDKTTRKTLVILLIISFLLSSMPILMGYPLENEIKNESFSQENSFTRNGITLYVGGNGPKNYSTIQEALNDSSENDTIYVYSGTYNENIIISSSITLLGENPTTTSIIGNGVGDVISIHSENVIITKFTIKNSGTTPMIDAGIEIHDKYAIIQNNIICDNLGYAVGIYINQSDDCIILNNTIYNNGNEGVYIKDSENNFVQDNYIYGNGHCSIVISESYNNTIRNNTLNDNNDAAISLWSGSHHNKIEYNTIERNPYSGIGIWEDAPDNLIFRNTFYDNPQYGIKIKQAKGNIISDNLIVNSSYGVYITSSAETTIEYNEITGGKDGVYIIDTPGNIIIKNYISYNENGLNLLGINKSVIHENYIAQNDDGIYLTLSSGVTISRNTISDNRWFGVWITNSTGNFIIENDICKNVDIGLYLNNAYENTITRNTIENNDDGIYIEFSTANTISENNFRNLKFNAFFVANNRSQCKNTWKHNFWDRLRIRPYKISGLIKLDKITIPWINIDWRPRITPYNLNVTVKSSYDGNILYVGGDGPGNYSSIQKAVDAAVDGDTVYVFGGTYYEEVFIDKSITLEGENKNICILEGNGSRDILTIISIDVLITGFTIQNGHFGIYLDNSSDIKIFENIFINNLHGISAYWSIRCKIRYNIFDLNQYSIRLYYCNNFLVFRNNFQSYKMHVFFVGSKLKHSRNLWLRNYWEKPRLAPYPIKGKIIKNNILVDWVDFDWFPALQDIASF